MRWFQNEKAAPKPNTAGAPANTPVARPSVPRAEPAPSAIAPVARPAPPLGDPIPDSVNQARANATRFLNEIYRTLSRGAAANTRYRIDPGEANQIGLGFVDCVREPYWQKNGSFPPVNAFRDYPVLHCVETALLSVRIGKELRYEEQDLVHLGIAALLANIGEYLLPQEIFQNEGPLSDAERKQVNEHPKTGYEMLRRFGFDAKVFVTVLQHHERWDGSGYPEGRRRNDIFRFARVLAVADTYHALISDRPWRPSMPPPEALEFVVGFGDELFELNLAQAILKVTPSYELGTRVRLSTGECGVVVDSNLGVQNRPIVRITTDAQGEALSEPYELDLAASANLSKLVTEVLAAAARER